MIDATLESISQRSRDIAINMLGVDKFGRITPGKMDPTKEMWWVRWTHILEELQLRGLGLPRDLNLIDRNAMKWASAPKAPRGLRILRGDALPSKPYMARIGQRKHLHEAITRGRIRIAPAAIYQDPSLNSAIQDDELSVTTVRSSRSPHTNTTINPSEIVSTWRHNENFFVLCLSHSYDMRLLDDFEGDALLVVHDPRRFSNRLFSAVKKSKPGLSCSIAPVRYYDPYFVDPTQGWIPTMKHFRFYYQNEIRFIWTGADPGNFLQPFFVELGALRDIAKLYTLAS
jgi:hypothetical protein